MIKDSQISENKKIQTLKRSSIKEINKRLDDENVELIIQKHKNNLEKNLNIHKKELEKNIDKHKKELDWKAFINSQTLFVFTFLITATIAVLVAILQSIANERKQCELILDNLSKSIRFCVDNTLHTSLIINNTFFYAFLSLLVLLVFYTFWNWSKKPKKS